MTLARRLVASSVILLVTTLLVFALPQLTGVDPARAALRARVAEADLDPVTLERLRDELGLDRPAPVRYGLFLMRLARADLGSSYVSRTPVATEVGRALRVSATLAAVAMTLAVMVGVPLGIATAARPDGPLDRTVRLASRLALALPEFVLAPVLMLTFALRLGLLPTGGWRGPASLVLPSLTLAVFPAALIAQLVRAETADALSQPFVRTARAKGLSPARVLFHASRVSLTSTLALGNVMTASMIGGAVVVEVIFAVPGVGRLLYRAVTSADLPMLEGGLLAVVVVALALGLLTDVAHTALEPTARLR
ncbi:MAG: ABC transporter permease [Egibacteraceae bacterium]